MNKEKSSRTKILEAALSEFGTYGYKEASTNRIYPIAGVSKGTIFKIFISKSMLFYEVYKKSLERMLLHMNEISYSNTRDIFEKITEMILWKLEYSKKHPFDTKILLEGTGNPPREIKSLVATHLRDLTKLSMRMFFEDIPMDNIRDEFTKEDVIKYVEIAVAGIQTTYINRELDIDYLNSIREDTIRYLKTVVRGMEKNNEKRI
ncbi:MAG: TetR/AcrR family transcriptional regulator [Firmicutes bacterium]|nr:TetR/AcrR family transcriptional regulator [Bacillota bacterium]